MNQVNIKKREDNIITIIERELQLVLNKLQKIPLYYAWAHSHPHSEHQQPTK